MDKIKTYIIDKPIGNTKRYGVFYDTVLNKFAGKYSGSTDIIVENVDKIFENIINLESQKKNLLLVGKVQSGKTSNLELLTALLFDNDYDIGIIYGGYDNSLLLQTVERFNNTFSEFVNVNNEDNNIMIFNTIDNTFKSEQQQLFSNKLRDGSKILIITIKNHQAIRNLNKFLKGSNFEKKKTFIIDDEGDQASLNTDFKKEKKSATYNNIVEMKNILKSPLYLSTTATPYAIVYQPEISELLPEKVSLIEPGIMYYGPDEFHLTNENIIYVENDDDKYTKDLHLAFLHFLLSSSIRYSQQKTNKAEMIIHMTQSIKSHEYIRDRINQEKTILEDDYKNDKSVFIKTFSRIYNSKYFSKEIIEKYDLKKLVSIIGETILRNCYLILHNSKGGESKENLEHKQFKIFIGGDLLQRGLTFPNLVTTYFTRKPKSGNVDTTLQRARWLGYRSHIKKIMRIFTLEELAQEFTNLTAIENDLWDQFYECEKGNIELKEIYLDLSDTTLQPSRSNVIDVQYERFGRKWKKQSLCLMDKNIIKSNNELINEMLSTKSFKNISLGRKDDYKNVMLYQTNFGGAKSLLESIQGIFQISPLNNLFINLSDDEKVDFITMFNNELSTRQRSFNDSFKITNLHQGLDTTNIERSKYLGDAAVIQDYNHITIQIFNIIPIFNKEPKPEIQQYMFAVYLPKEGKIVRRK